jgi:trans-2-enoyl-CoA reductase
MNMFGLLQSKGLKRTVSVLLFLAGQAASVVPAVAPYAAILNEVAIFFGVIGVGHAAVAASKEK